MSVEDLADRLDAIAEELDDLVTDRLRAAVSDVREKGAPDPEMLKEERRIARARRSVAKAAEILRQPSGGGAGSARRRGGTDDEDGAD